MDTNHDPQLHIDTAALNRAEGTDGQEREQPSWEQAAIEDHGAETIRRARKLVADHPHIDADTPDGLTRAINDLRIRDEDAYIDGLKFDATINNDPALYNKAIRLELGDDEVVTEAHPAADAPPNPDSLDIADGGEAEPPPDAPQAPSFPLFENDLQHTIDRARGAVRNQRPGPPDRPNDRTRTERTDPGPDLGL